MYLESKVNDARLNAARNRYLKEYKRLTRCVK